MFRHALIWSTLLATVLVSRQSRAQLAPTGTHYAGRASDTGFTGPNERGGYSATVPLDLPPSRGGLPIPLQIVSGTHGFGAAGVGWDIPLSFVYVDHTYAHRRPARTSTNGVAARERVTVALLGRSMEMLVQGNHWIARNDPTVTMMAVDGTWQVVDGNGVSYTFLKDARLYATGGPGIADPGGMWLLDSIQGRGGAVVQLHYKIGTVEVAPDPEPLITIDLQDIQYNNLDPSRTCFKHEIDLVYDGEPEGAPPQAISILGERVIARYHKLYEVVVRSRASCAEAPKQLRAYELSYSTDQDTRQQQLTSVVLHGQDDLPSDTPTLPVATYQYGTASTLVNGAPMLQYGDATTTTSIHFPFDSNPFLASTAKVSTSLFQPPTSGSSYAATQSLQDFNGDGRPDLVFTTNDGKLEIAAGKSGMEFAPAAPLVDNAFKRNVLDTRSSSTDRFASETTDDDQIQDYVWTQSIDVNGDGRIDVLDAAEKPNMWVAYLNTPDPGPSGIKWVRVELNVKSLRAQMATNGLSVPPDYLPLSARKTGRDMDYYYHWLWADGCYVRATEIVGLPDNPHVIPEPPALMGHGPEKTYTEYKVIDMNGDGYPDVLFNSAPTSLAEPVAPECGHHYGDANGYSVTQTQGFGPHWSNHVEVAYNTAGVFTEATGTAPFADPTELVGPTGCGVELWSGGVGGDETVDRMQSANCMFADVNGDGLVDRIQDDTALLGTGFSFGAAQVRIPEGVRYMNFATQLSTYLDACTHANPPEWFPVTQDTELRDLTGDGIPDLIEPYSADRPPYLRYQVYVGTGGGFASPIPIETPVTGGRDWCNGALSSTDRGFFDVNGDGHPDLVQITNGGNTIAVSQLSGGSRPGVPEAGRLTRIDNGYGASISVSYMSAKDDPRTIHNVPFPEVVVSSIQTDGNYGLGGTLAATNYAYGKIDMFYDSLLDGFRSLGYQRRVAVTITGTGKDGSPVTSATITDAYPLEDDTPANFYYLTEQQRLGRYLQAGRVSDTTSLAGEIGVDPWALLSVDTTTDVHRIAGTHYSIDIGDTHSYSDATSPSGEACVDVAFPYDFYTSSHMSTYDPCSTRAFLYTSSTQSWRGSEAPPSAKNVQVYTSVRSVDDLGRITSIIYQNDATQDDDDVCVDTTYATPTDPVVHVLNAPASRKVWACGNKEDGHTVAEESWEYDKQYTGLVFEGLPTSHTVYRHATDTGAPLGVNREYDADYDALGNPAKITSTRDDGAARWTTITYDIFGIGATEVSVVGSDATIRHVSQLADPISGALLSSTDENGTTHRFTWDAFGRPLTTTLQRPEDNEPGLLSVHSYDGFTGPNVHYGRSVKVRSYTDPLASNDTSTIGRESTTHFDELGRELSTEVDLGGDYNDTLIVGSRTYDPLGRVVFEADAYPKSQDAATAYGTSRIFNDDGSLLAEIRGRGPQVYSLYPDPSTEFYPTLYWHQFDNHVETTGVKQADALTAGTPQEGVTRQATSTAIGRVLARSTYENNTSVENATYSYDLLGNQTSVARYADPVNAVNPVIWLWQFDSLGQVTSLSEPTDATQTRAYDSWGELKTIEWHPTTEPVHGIEITYDSLGRTLASYEENNHVLDPLTVTTYAYDVPGTSTRISPANVKGRLAKASSPTEDIVFGYDGLGHVNARSFTDLNNVEYVEQQGVHADGSQAFIQLQLPDDGYATERVDYDYDSASRLRWMWFSNGQTTQELYNADQLDPWGRARHAMFGATTYTANYFDIGRRLPKQVNVTSSLGTRTIEFDGFDAVGRELSRTEQIPNVGGTTSSTYDALGRLQSSVRTNGGATTQDSSFSYDALGNVVSLQNHLTHLSASLGYQSGATSDFDKLCTVTYFGRTPLQCTVVHDSFGNVTSEPVLGGSNSFSYFNSGDVKHLSNTAGMTATFAYDPFGDVQDLNITSSAGQVRHDEHFGDLITLRSQNTQTPSTSFISRQFPGPGMTISRRGAQGPWVFQFSGAQGTRFTTDENGKFVQDVSYTPYGTAASTGAAAGTSTFTTDQWNEGDALDGFGLVQVGKRIYDPSIGRFLSRDPLLIPRTAATTNPYAFAMNDPINLSDPSGMDPGDPTCSIDQLCISSSTGSGGYYGSLASLAAFAGWAATYQSATGMEPPMPASSVDAIKAYSAMFNANLTTIQLSGRFGYQDSGGFLSAVGDFGSGFGGAVWDAGADAIHSVAHPLDTIEGIAHAVAHPVQTAEAIGHGITSTASAIMSGDWKAAGRAAGTIVATFGPGAAAGALGKFGVAGTIVADEGDVVRAYEVGTYDVLQDRSAIGDGLDLHHAGQAHAMEQVVPGYERATGPAIALPAAEHKMIPNLKGEVKMSARDVLARDIRNLRRFTGAPNSALQQLIELNKSMYPGAFAR